MKLIDKDLLLALEAYARGWFRLEQLRAFLAERFFPLPPGLNPFEAMVIGELELRMAEMDRGDRPEADVREAAELFAIVFKTLQRAPVQPLTEPALI